MSQAGSSFGFEFEKGCGVDGKSMNDTRKKGGLQTVLQQQQSKKLYKKRLKGTCRLADYCFIFLSIYIFEFPPQLSANCQ